VDFLEFMALAGGLLLLMGLSSGYLRRLPVSTSAIYLLVGVGIGPLGLEWLRVDLLSAADWLERLTEIAVIVALFVGGLKLRLPFRDPAWAAAWRLAGPTMLGTIVLVALAAHWLLGYPPALAVLLGAILAPTDPVLASAVAVSDAADHDRLRYGLSGEAGLNDGMAFPFVAFALLWAREGGLDGSWVRDWFLSRVVWAVPAGLLVGFALGWSVGRLAIWLRARHRDTAAPSDFLALALIALSYVAADLLGAWGFLSAFAAGVGLRHAEVEVSHAEASPGSLERPPAERLVGPDMEPEDLEEPAVAAGVMFAETLSFGDTAERLLEVMLVVLVGIALAVHWDPRSVPLALVLFLVIRPLTARLLLAGTPTTPAQRWLMGWFGIRGIGSLYYLTYAFSHGITGEAAQALARITMSVVALSVVIHGLSARPLLAGYERSLTHRRGRG
jgi:NhaP-type Na+/H+ or K+/H+ antiporter